MYRGTIPLARHRYDADALGGNDACVDQSDDGHSSVNTDDTGEDTDIDLFSNIAVDDESDYGIDN